MKTEKPHHIGTLSPEMALLGLLYKDAGHGYDLHRTVNADLGQVWHLSQSQAYAILKRLEVRGDISAEEIPQKKLPNRQLLQMTAQGRENFLAWLNAPSGGSTRAIRMEFITRLYFLNLYFPKKLTLAFDQQRAEAKTHIQRLEKTLAELPAVKAFLGVLGRLGGWILKFLQTRKTAICNRSKYSGQFDISKHLLQRFWNFE